MLVGSFKLSFPSVSWAVTGTGKQWPWQPKFALLKAKLPSN